VSHLANQGEFALPGIVIRKQSVTVAGVTTPKIPGVNRRMESAEYTSAALGELHVRQVERIEEGHYQEQMARYYYLGELAKIGETVWQVAT